MIQKIRNYLMLSFCLVASTGNADNFPAPAVASPAFIESLSRGKQAAPPVASSATSFRSSGVSTEKLASKGCLIQESLDTSERIQLLRKEALIDFAKNLLIDRGEELCVDSDEFNFKNSYQRNLNGKILLLGLPRTYRGLPVKGAELLLTFAKNKQFWLPRSIKNHTFGKIVVRNEDDVEPTRADLVRRIGFSNFEVIATETLLLPEPELTDESEWLKTKIFTFAHPDTKEVYKVALSFGETRLIEASKSKYEQSKKFLSANVYRRSYMDNSFSKKILGGVDLKTENSQLQTGLDGGFEADLPLSIEVTLANSAVRITTNNSSNPIKISTDINSDTPIETSGQSLRALNAFTIINAISRYTRRFIKLGEAPGILESQIRLRIDVSGNCNAFYNGSISMFSEGGGCANMALVNDVVIHEWGHGLDDYTGTGRGGIDDGAFSEGIGDIVAAYFSNNSNMGQGFFMERDRGIRQLANAFRFPGDRGEVHAEGQIIGGAFWDMRLALLKRYGPVKGDYVAGNLFFRHLLSTDTYTRSFETLVDLDDDDGNPATPSPNHCLIIDAFKAHGLSDEPDCTDTPDPNQLTPAEDLHLGLIDEGSDTFIAISLEGKAPPELCYGDSYECDSSDQLEMDLEGKKNGRYFYVSRQPFSMEDHAIISVSTGAGSAKKGRKFKIIARN